MPIAVECWVKVKVPDSNMRTGMKTKSIMCGLMPDIIVTEEPIGPKSFRKYPNRIPNTSSIGVYGMPVFLFISRRMEPQRRPKKMKRTARGPF